MREFVVKEGFQFQSFIHTLRSMVLGDDRELGRLRMVVKEVRYIAVLLGAMSFVRGGVE